MENKKHYTIVHHTCGGHGCSRTEIEHVERTSYDSVYKLMLEMKKIIKEFNDKKFEPYFKDEFDKELKHEYGGKFDLDFEHGKLSIDESYRFAVVRVRYGDVREFHEFFIEKN